MTRIAVYHDSVPNKKSQEKIDILVNFSKGAKICGETVYDVKGYGFQPADVAIIQGWISDRIDSSHLKLRNTVIQQQLKHKKYVVGVDSNLFLYKDNTNPHHYLRYSFNGIFPKEGIYCDTEIDPTRWQKLSQASNLSLKEWRAQGNHILLLLQRNGGWSMGKLDVQQWAINTIAELRKYTDRPIVIRAHPGDKASREYLDPKNPKCKIKFSRDITLSTNKNLEDDLKDCWAAINYNSSPVVGAAIEGVPIFVMNPEKSQCAEIANTDLSQIENPLMPNRQPWVERLSMFHWNFTELASGECWQHMRKFIK